MFAMKSVAVTTPGSPVLPLQSFLGRTRY
jgi:hypothetical protein